MVLLVWHYTTIYAGVGNTVAGEGRTGLGHLYQLNQSTVSAGVWTIPFLCFHNAVKDRSMLVTLPRNLIPYHDSVDGTRDHVTYQKLVTQSRYGLVRCSVSIWASIKGMIQLRPEQVWTCYMTRNHRLLLCTPFRYGCFCFEEWCESVGLCGLLSVLVIVKWSGLRKVP